jgi:hypothetical protein
MIGASSADIPKTKAIEELLAKGIGGIAGSSTTPPQPDAAAPPTQAAKSTLKVEAEDYIFELVQCKLSGTTLTCYLIITNNAADRQLSIYAPNLGFGSHSRIIDQFGNEVSGRIAVLANNGRDYAELVSGIPIKGNIKFENVSTNMTSLALLELACSSYPRNFKVQFRNAPITK